jgi:hypothetical protein
LRVIFNDSQKKSADIPPRPEAFSRDELPGISAMVDLLILSLGFENNTAASIWENTNLPETGRLDVFNIQHLLAAFNLAASKAKKQIQLSDSLETNFSCFNRRFEFLG